LDHDDSAVFSYVTASKEAMTHHAQSKEQKDDSQQDSKQELAKSKCRGLSFRFPIVHGSEFCHISQNNTACRILAAGSVCSKQLFSAAPSPSPTVPFAPPQFVFGLLPTWCALA
jgi:hypothetical protein